MEIWEVIETRDRFGWEPRQLTEAEIKEYADSRSWNEDPNRLVTELRIGGLFRSRAEAEAEVTRRQKRRAHSIRNMMNPAFSLSGGRYSPW